MKKNTNTTNRKNMFYWQVDRPFNEREIKEIFLDRHQNYNPKHITAVIEYGLRQTGKSKAKVAKLNKSIKFGSVNVVCKAALTDGTKVVIRAHPEGIDNGYFWAESIASQKAKDAGVPTYSTYFIDDTRKKFNFDYMIIECLPGVTMKSLEPIPPELDARLVEETGHYLAKVHTIKTENFGFFDNQTAKRKKQLIGLHNNWKSHIYAAFADNLDYLTNQEVITSKQRRQIEDIFIKHEDIIKCEHPSLIQNDLADWNELVENNHVTGIIDWDECYSGDPVCDFSAWSVFFPFSRMEHLKRGYKQVATLPDGFEEKLHLYRLRYIVSKMVTRKKKLVFGKSKFIQKLLDFALDILQDELKWYGY